MILEGLTTQDYQNSPTFNPWHLKEMNKRKALLQHGNRYGCWLPRNIMSHFRNWIFSIMQLSCKLGTCNSSFTCACLPIHSFNKYLVTWTDQGPGEGRSVLKEQAGTVTVINHTNKLNRSDSGKHYKEHKTRMHNRKQRDRRWLQVEMMRTSFQT